MTVHKKKTNGPDSDCVDTNYSTISERSITSVVTSKKSIQISKTSENDNDNNNGILTTDSNWEIYMNASSIPDNILEMKKMTIVGKIMTLHQEIHHPKYETWKKKRPTKKNKR